MVMGGRKMSLMMGWERCSLSWRRMDGINGKVFMVASHCLELGRRHGCG